MKKVLLLLLVVSIIAGSAACDAGEPDKLGAWSQINQTVLRPAGWEQIVNKSEFQLGERRLEGYWDEPANTEAFYEADYGTYPRIDGSTVCVPMAVEFARQHLGFSDDDATNFVFFYTTDEAYNNLILKRIGAAEMIRSTNTFIIEKAVDIIIATEPSDEELMLAKENGVELIVKPVCYDSFVFITHKNNPVDSLTVEQVQKIYSGEITNWKEVGGYDQKIAAFQREENSGSQTTMEKQVMQGRKMTEPTKVNVIMGMGDLVKAVAEYQNSTASIGYTFKYYIDTLYRNENIKVLKIEGVEPNAENMRSGEYRFTTCYYGVIRAEDENGIGGKFLDWMLSEEGQRCIAQAGYCTVIEF